MQFLCTTCGGNPEEIIGDGSPKCLRCSKPMVAATLSYKGLWLSPSFVIHRMQKIIEKHGNEEASSGRFKKEREAWTTAAWALGLKEIGETDSWVEIETVERTPDTKLHQLDQSTGHNKIETRNIEVVDWEEHVDDAMDVIKKKCANAYPRYFGLLVLGRSGKVLDVDSVVKAIRGTCVPFAEIWILGRPLEAHARVQMARLFPDRTDIGFDLADAVRRSEGQREIMRPEGRGTGTDFHHRGDVWLPIP